MFDATITNGIVVVKVPLVRWRTIVSVQRGEKGKFAFWAEILEGEDKVPIEVPMLVRADHKGGKITQIKCEALPNKKIWKRTGAKDNED